MAFRDTRGEVGLLAANCPHRGASLFFGRNEECGLRCAYHGWKFDVTGRCVDMPNEPEESTFKDKVRARAYPVPRRQRRDLDVHGPARGAAAARRRSRSTRLPAEQVYPPLMMLEECNWVQALEGDIDSSHIDFVHGKLRADSTQRGTYHRDKRPRLEMLPTDYGACYSARRRWDVDGLYWHRITQFIMPFFSMIAASDPHIVRPAPGCPWTTITPCSSPSAGRLDRPVTEEERRQVADPFAAWGGYVDGDQRPADALLHEGEPPQRLPARLRAAAERAVIGIPFLGNLQDRAMTETMGPIYDRTQEHLGTTDAMVIFVRRRLSTAARALREHGAVPANVDDPTLCRVRPASVLLPEGESWIAATEKARQSDAGVPIAWVPFLVVEAGPSPRPERRSARSPTTRPCPICSCWSRWSAGANGCGAPSTRSCPAAPPRPRRRWRRSTGWSSERLRAAATSCGSAAPRSPCPAPAARPPASW